MSDGAATGTNQIVVTMISAADALARLIARVESLDLDPRNWRPRLVTLSALQAAFARGDFRGGVEFAEGIPEPGSCAEWAGATWRRGAPVIIDAKRAPAGGAEPKLGAPRGRFQAVIRHDNGHVRVKFEGVPCHLYPIQTSTNLVYWDTAGVGTEVTDGEFEFENANAAPYSTRFYRTVQSP